MGDHRNGDVKPVAEPCAACRGLVEHERKLWRDLLHAHQMIVQGANGTSAQSREAGVLLAAEARRRLESEYGIIV